MSTKENEGYIQCEKLALLDLSVRSYKKVDRLPITEMINVSDAIQGIFEYIWEWFKLRESFKFYGGIDNERN